MRRLQNSKTIKQSLLRILEQTGSMGALVLGKVE